MIEWDKVSYVMASKVRFGILTSLNKKVMTPIELTKELNIPISSVSKTLGELVEKDLIECLTPKRRKSRIYNISKSGREILEKIHEITRSKND